MAENKVRAERYDRKLEYWVSSRALMILLATSFVGLMLGNIIIGFIVGVAYVAWWLVAKFVKEANYSINIRGGSYD